jgi:hypothetical protein
MSALRFAAISIALLFGPALAGPPAASAPLAREGDRQAWEERFREARRALAEAQARHDGAIAAYKKMRSRNKARGDAKVAILTEREEAKAALAEAEQSLQALTEQARRAGVPPGWLRSPAAWPAAPGTDD